MNYDNALKWPPFNRYENWREIDSTLEIIPPHWSLTPLREKRPYRQNWQTEEPVSRSYIRQLLEFGEEAISKKTGKPYTAYISGVGLRTGDYSDGLLSIDFDGLSSLPIWNVIKGEGEDPKTVSWSSGKPGREQRAYQIPLQYRETLKDFNRIALKEFDGVSVVNGELLEFRYNHCQSVLPPSYHPTTGSYHWINSPQDTELAIAPQWLIDFILKLVSEDKRRNEELERTRLEKRKQWELHKKELITRGHYTWNDDIDFCRHLLNFINPDLPYDEWLKVGMVLHSVSDRLLSDFDYWSSRGSKYKGFREIEQKWCSFRGNGVSIGTLVKYAQDGGFSFPKKEYIPYNEPDSEYYRWLEEEEKNEQAHATLGLIKNFKNTIAKHLKRVKPPLNQEKPQPQVIDYDPTKGLPSPEEYQAMGEPIIEFTENISHAKIEMEAIALDAHALNISFMGTGKTSSVPELGGKVIYCSNEHRNPSIEKIKHDFKDLDPRNKDGFYEQDGIKKKVTASTPPELRSEAYQASKCIQADKFNKLAESGYQPNEKGSEGVNPICAGCPLFKAKVAVDKDGINCNFSGNAQNIVESNGKEIPAINSVCDSTPGFYRNDRRETFEHRLIRASSQSLSRDEVDPERVFVIEEATRELPPVLKITTYLNYLIIEVDRAKDIIESLEISTGEKTEFKTYLDTLLKSFKQLFKQKHKYGGITHDEILKLLPLHPSLSDLITVLDGAMLVIKELIETPDKLEVSRADFKEHPDLVKLANKIFKQEAIGQTERNFDNLLPNGLVNILKAINGERVALRLTGKTLNITIDNRWIGRILDGSKGAILKDATATADIIRKITGVKRPIYTIRRKIDKPLKNLKILQIPTPGLNSNQWSDQSSKSVTAILDKLREEYGYFCSIVPKAQAASVGGYGYWFRDSRSTNEFEGHSVLAWAGLPLPNLGEIQDLYLVINGSLEGWETYYQELVRAEIVQGIGGRQRCHQYPDLQFLAIVITGDKADLSFMGEYGCQIEVKHAFDVTPQAGTARQKALHYIVTTIEKYGASTQAAIAHFLGTTQQYISKHLRGLGLTLTELIEKINNLIKTNTTPPINNGYKTCCITDQLYKDKWWRRLLDLPPMEKVKQVISAIHDLGWHDFRIEFLDKLPESLQIETLSELIAIYLSEEGLNEQSFDTQ